MMTLIIQSLKISGHAISVHIWCKLRSHVGSAAAESQAELYKVAIVINSCQGK